MSNGVCGQKIPGGKTTGETGYNLPAFSADNLIDIHAAGPFVIGEIADVMHSAAAVVQQSS